MDTDCYCDYEQPEFYSKRVNTARLIHCCEECNKAILPGEKYESVAVKWDGYFYTIKTCEKCCELRQWVTNNVPCFCWYHHNMLDDAKLEIEEATFRAPDETQGLRFGFLRRLYGVRNSDRPNYYEAIRDNRGH